ncbi:hypothetical protein FQN54_001197 [Arachnomyces sp. PD_36]|nr:hypothetical protein FQN54_001197 [Arachnomyces sp. PD_36]
MGEWKTLISRLDTEAGWSLSPPAEKNNIKSTETTLNHPLPADLSALLLETNGINDTVNYTTVIWDVERIKTDNQFLRTDSSMQELYMPFESLLFFGDFGNGDLFGYARTGTGNEIFVWDHENDSRVWVASGLEQYLERTAEAAGDDWYFKSL